MRQPTSFSVLALMAALSMPVSAQEASDAPAEAPVEATETQSVEAGAEALLTQAELEQLVAPVALYPDTLLVQLLVAATYPLQVVKAGQSVEAVADMEEAARKEALEAEGFDPSVEVLAVAFPTVLEQMAENIDWTESLGVAMLAQSDDVMDTIQLLRSQAIETGALIDTPEQEVTIEETLSTSGEPVETVIVQPTNPETVYVPQYDSTAVYDTNSTTDLWAAGLMGFATYAIIDAIFNDNDDWYDYWGCRNCGGWNGGPIINDPSIDIDIDGDVIIGDRPDRPERPGEGKRPERPERPGNGERPERPEGWEPDPDRQQEARDKIAERGGGASIQPAGRPADSGDALRAKLSQQAGTADISRPENADALRDAAVAAGAVGGVAAGREALKRSGDRKDIPVNRPSTAQRPADRPKVDRPATKPAAKPQVSKPKASKPATSRPAAKPQAKRPTSGHSKPAIKKHSSGSRAKAASSRGHAGKAKRR